nr:solute carrier family 2, facilitated glucose transporter member 2-like isoform X1 [Lytechinus pictus]
MYGLLTISAIAFTLFLIFEYRVSWLSWFALVAICVFFIAFPLGPEIFTPLVCSELWSVGPRKAALSVTQHIGWWVDVVIQFCFPTLLVAIGAYTFIIFAASLAITTLIILLYLPETKDRRFVEVSTGFEEMKNPDGDEDQSFTKYQEGYSPLPLMNR